MVWHQQGFGGGGGGVGLGAAAAAADGVRANIINEKNKLSMVDLLDWVLDSQVVFNWLHPFMRAFPKTGANFFRDHFMETQIPKHCARIH